MQGGGSARPVAAGTWRSGSFARGEVETFQRGAAGKKGEVQRQQPIRLGVRCLRTLVAASARLPGRSTAEEKRVDGRDWLEKSRSFHLARSRRASSRGSEPLPHHP